MKALAVFLAATVGGVAVGWLRTLLKPRPEEFEPPVSVIKGRRATAIIIDDLYDGLPATDEERAELIRWWEATKGNSKWRG